MAKAIDEAGDNALRPAGFRVVCGHAQAGGRVQKFVGVDIGTDRAGGNCGGEHLRRAGRSR